MSRASLTDDEEFLKAQIRSLDNEIRDLRENLRDRFAMAAIPAIISKHFPVDTSRLPKPKVDLIKQRMAEGAYDIADAMLEARKP